MFHACHRFGINQVIGWKKNQEKKTPPCYVGKVEESGDFAKVPKLNAPHVD